MTSLIDPHSELEPLISGVPLSEASYALVLVHGRGGSADGMLPIARTGGATDAYLIAPRATGGTWYPRRFLDPMASNEPYLSSALASVDSLANCRLALVVSSVVTGRTCSDTC